MRPIGDVGGEAGESVAGGGGAARLSCGREMPTTANGDGNEGRAWKRW